MTNSKADLRIHSAASISLSEHGIHVLKERYARSDRARDDAELEAFFKFLEETNNANLVVTKRPATPYVRVRGGSKVVERRKNAVGNMFALMTSAGASMGLVAATIAPQSELGVLAGAIIGVAAGALISMRQRKSSRKDATA